VTWRVVTLAAGPLHLDRLTLEDEEAEAAGPAAPLEGRAAEVAATKAAAKAKLANPVFADPNLE
jgi:hypothetical protein